MARSHVHGRSYFGEFEAGPLLEWLNSARKPADDPVEKLLSLNAKASFEYSAHEIERYLARVVSRSKLAVAPVVLKARATRWDIDWRLVGKMYPPQALALVRLLHLADKGLIGRVRSCARQDCRKWFYAKFDHQRFHSAQCQQETFRSDPEWRKQRAEYMKRLRREQKDRERRGLQRVLRERRKGKR